jgi:hypothetical protein
MKVDHDIPETTHPKTTPSNQYSHYALPFKGYLDPQWDWLENLTIAHSELTMLCAAFRLLTRLVCMACSLESETKI